MLSKLKGMPAKQLTFILAYGALLDLLWII